MEHGLWISDAEMYRALGYLTIFLVVVFGLGFLLRYFQQKEERKDQHVNDEYIQLIDDAIEQVEELRSIFNESPSNKRKS